MATCNIQSSFALGAAVSTDTSALQMNAKTQSWPSLPPPQIVTQENKNGGNSNKKKVRDRPVECTINNCGRRFSSDNSLRNHIRRKHSSRAILGRPSEYTKRNPLWGYPSIGRTHIPPSLSPMDMEFSPNQMMYGSNSVSPNQQPRLASGRAPLHSPLSSPLSPSPIGSFFPPVEKERAPNFGGHLAPPCSQPLARSLSVDGKKASSKPDTVSPPILQNQPQPLSSPNSMQLENTSTSQRRHSIMDTREVLSRMSPDGQVRAVNEIKDWLAAKIYDVTSQLAVKQAAQPGFGCASTSPTVKLFDDDISMSLANLDLEGLELGLPPQPDIPISQQLQSLQMKLENQVQQCQTPLNFPTSAHALNSPFPDDTQLNLGINNGGKRISEEHFSYSTNSFLNMGITPPMFLPNEIYDAEKQLPGIAEASQDKPQINFNDLDLENLVMENNAMVNALQSSRQDTLSLSCPPSLYGSFDCLPGGGGFENYGSDQYLPQPLNNSEIEALCSQLKAVIDDNDFLMQ